MLLCGVIGYGVIGVEEAAVEVEQPFGAGRLPERAMCCAVRCGCVLCPLTHAVCSWRIQPLRAMHAILWTTHSKLGDADGMLFAAPPIPAADFNDIPLDTIVAQTHKTMAGVMRCAPAARVAGSFRWLLAGGLVGGEEQVEADATEWVNTADRVADAHVAHAAARRVPLPTCRALLPAPATAPNRYIRQEQRRAVAAGEIEGSDDSEGGSAKLEQVVVSQGAAIAK